jgi:cytochrome P450 family 135
MSLPPGPRLPKAAQTAQLARDAMGYMRRCRARYGDLFTLRYYPFDTLVYVCDPEVIREIFTGDPEVFRAGEANQFMEPILGPRSVLLLDGGDHLRMRKLMLPPFHGRSVTRYRDVIADIAARELETWPIGRSFPLRPRMQDITLEVIMRAVFGIEDPGLLARLRAALVRMINVNMIHGTLPFTRVDLGPRSPWGRYLRARAAADEIIFEQIASRRAQSGGVEHDDVLALLLAVEDEDGDGLTDAELRDELMTLLIAGHETTATALAWAFERLVRHPAALARLREEADTDEDAYVDAVVKETLRSRPVVIDVARTLAAPARLGGYDLPAGVMVVPMITLVQTGPGAWEDPDAFRPERFLDGAQPDPYTWIPFGGGVRRCLGASFATFEIKVVLETILPAADLIPSSPEAEAARLRHVTLVPARGGEVVLERRRPARPRTTPAAVAA